MYQRVQNTEAVVRREDGAFIPCTASNRDYQAYLAWMGKGNTPLEAESVPDVAVEAPSKAELQLQLAELSKKVEALT